MSQTRLNSFIVLHIHKDMTDILNFHHIVNTFISNVPEHRSDTMVNDVIIPWNTINFFPIHFFIHPNLKRPHPLPGLTTLNYLAMGV